LPIAVEDKPPLRDDGTPYYVQLASIIRRQIADETWHVGDQLPTLKELVVMFGVSPMTVRHALSKLEDEGLIRAERGRGTFVTSKPDMPISVPYLLTRSPSKPTGELSFAVIASRPATDELRISDEEGIALPPYRYMKRTFSRASLHHCRISCGASGLQPDTRKRLANGTGQFAALRKPRRRAHQCPPDIPRGIFPTAGGNRAGHQDA
jgi:DNA-binding transcriptional MocR family regulator